MNKKLAGLVAGAIGIAALAWGLFSSRWVVGTDLGAEIRVGLRSTELCQTVRPDLSQPGVESCVTVSNDDLANSPSAIDGFDTFLLVSKITFYSGLACAAVLVILLALALARLFPVLPIAPSTVGIVLSFGTLILIAVTLAIHPWKKVGWGTGSAMVIAGAGAVACLFAAIMLGRRRPAASDDAW